MDWKKFFDNLAVSEKEEHRKVGWGSPESQYSKFHASFDFIRANTERLLDMGCGTGTYLELLSDTLPFVETYGVDISFNQLTMAKEKKLPSKLVLASMLELPFPERFFDCVTCIGVLQNFSGSLTEFLKESGRVLRDDGLLFLVTMDKHYEGFLSGERKLNPINTYYVPEEMKQIVENEGFSVLSMNAISSLRREGLIVPLHSWHTFYLACRK